MPRRQSSALPFVAAALAAGCCVLAAFVFLRSSGQSLGPPSPSLTWVERTALEVYLVLHRGDLLSAAGPAGVEETLDVEPGMDAAGVARALASLGIVRDPQLLTTYLRYRGLDTHIEAGRFRVSGEMSVVEIAGLLQRARDSRYRVVIPEGWRREQIAEALGGLGLGFSVDEFLQATQRPPPAWSQAAAGAADLEGFLFPDTYQLDPQLSAEATADLMVSNLEGRLSSDLKAGFAAHGLTPFQAVTLASIVEREAAVASERPLIASVFLNRLALDIPLQSDPTVQFALGAAPDEWWKAPLTAEDLQIDSPYNTYRVHGLPPGPISSPGIASLESVAAPADTAYLFFRAACDGSGRHVFATTFEEHLANACP